MIVHYKAGKLSQETKSKMKDLQYSELKMQEYLSVQNISTSNYTFPCIDNGINLPIDGQNLINRY